MCFRARDHVVLLHVEWLLFVECVYMPILWLGVCVLVGSHHIVMYVLCAVLCCMVIARLQQHVMAWHRRTVVVRLRSLVGACLVQGSLPVGPGPGQLDQRCGPGTAGRPSGRPQHLLADLVSAGENLCSMRLCIIRRMRVCSCRSTRTSSCAVHES